jgi:hypothetical protein
MYWSIQMCGWVQRGDRARLALKAFAEGRVAADVRRQDLDRNDPIEARILCFVDLAHPACTEGGLDLVRPKASTGTEGHGLL